MDLIVLSNLNSSLIQSRNADCKKAHFLLNSHLGGKNNREMVFAPNTCWILVLLVLT